MKHVPGCGPQVAFLKVEPRAARPEFFRTLNGLILHHSQVGLFKVTPVPRLVQLLLQASDVVLGVGVRISSSSVF